MLMIDMITDAYRLAGIISEIESPSAEQGQKAVLRSNNMFADLAEDGIDFGYNPKPDTAATIVLPLGQIAGATAMLAMKLCAEEGFAVPAHVAYEADRWYQRQLGRAVSAQIERAQSDTLPVGESQRYGYNILTGN